MSGRPIRQVRKRGFALLMVLGALVVLALLAGATATTVARLRAAAAQQQAQVLGGIDAYSTEQTLLFMLATQRMTFGGLTVNNTMVMNAQDQAMQMQAQPGMPVISFTPVGNELRLDGTLYRGVGRADFALQDDRGRLSPNWAIPGMMQGLMRELGVPIEERGKLTDRLRDYQDSDDLPLLNGAEAPAYAARKLPPPPDRPLLTPYELLRVMSWGKYLAPLGYSGITRNLTVARNVSINVNTASLRVLETVPGVTPDQAKRVLAMRALAPLNSYPEAQVLLPSIPPDSGLLSLYPSSSGTLEIWPGEGSAGWLVHYTLTPFENDGSPWRIDYALRLARPLQTDVAVVRAMGAALLAGPLFPQPAGTAAAASGARGN